MSETPIYDNHDKPTPIYDKLVSEEPEKIDPDKPWYQKLLTPTFRRWAYGVAAAAVTAGSIWAGKPEFAATALPLIMAIAYVDKDGEPK